MKLERIIGSIITDKGPRPFVLHVQNAKFEVDAYAVLDEAQRTLSVIQLQRFAQLIQELANVSFAQVRLGEYYCTQCRRWVDVTREAWKGSVCASCAPEGGDRPAASPAVEEAAPVVEEAAPAVVEEAGPAVPQAAVEGEEVAAGEAEEAAAGDAEEDLWPGPEVIEALLTLDEAEMLEKAILLAVEAHQGQRDKAGAPYILHPLRMMLRMETPVGMMAAVLHDVVEDSMWTLEALRREGFPEEVVEAVAGLTRRGGETYDAFIERASLHPLARQVKLADLEDNMDLRRLDALTEKDQARLARYQRAWQRLKQEGL